MAFNKRFSKKTPYGKVVKAKKPVSPPESPYSWVFLPTSAFKKSDDRKLLVQSILRSYKTSFDPGHWFKVVYKDWYLNSLQSVLEEDPSGTFLVFRADSRDRSVELVGKIDPDDKELTLVRPLVLKKIQL